MSLGVCFIKKKLHSSKLARLLDTASIFALFSVSDLKDKKSIKSKPTRKLKHANSILECFEYFCQISSKSIAIILSYTVSKLTRFFWDTVYLHFRQEYFNTTNLNNIVFFSFCRSLYRHITTVYIFCPMEAPNLHIRWQSPIVSDFIDWLIDQWWISLIGCCY